MAAIPPRDPATLFAFLNRAWSIVSTLGFIAIVVVRLSPEIQGYYFTFVSLLVLLQFADMGFAYVLVQFSSHEWVDLRFVQGRIEGAARAKARLGSLIRVAIRWYGAACVLFFVVLGAGGHLFFAGAPNPAGIDWQGPWWLLCLLAAVYLLLPPVTGLLEGCHRVLTSQRNQFVANVCGTLVGWATLLGGGELYALAAMFAVRVILGHALNTRAALPLLRLAREPGDAHRIPWRAEFWPLQWRVSVSWLAGFFVYQSFTPIAFQFEGAIAAGQIGVMVQAYQAVNLLASARLSVDQPRMGVLAARGDLPGLRALVRRSIRRNLATAVVIAAAAIVVMIVLKSLAPEIGRRLGSTIGFSVFVVTAVLMQIAIVETAAVRFQKREPFVAVSIIMAALMFIASLGATWRYGSETLPFVFISLNWFIQLPWIHRTYRRNM
jgi:hypothetical protein